MKQHKQGQQKIWNTGRNKESGWKIDKMNG